MNDFISCVLMVLAIVIVFSPYCSLWNLSDLKKIEKISQSIDVQTDAIDNLERTLQKLTEEMRRLRQDQET